MSIVKEVYWEYLMRQQEDQVWNLGKSQAVAMQQQDNVASGQLWSKVWDPRRFNNQ